LPLPQQVLLRIQSSASSFSFNILLFCLHHRPVATYIFLVNPSLLCFLLSFL
jgi:hypothetical protein